MTKSEHSSSSDSSSSDDEELMQVLKYKKTSNYII